MSALTRRRSKDVHAESWQIFYGDVQVGTIGTRAGVPVDVDQWGWSCGFYPRSHRQEHHEGTAETFEQGAGRLRSHVARLPARLHRGGLHRVSTAASMDVLEVCNVARGAEKKDQAAA